MLRRQGSGSFPHRHVPAKSFKTISCFGRNRMVVIRCTWVARINLYFIEIFISLLRRSTSGWTITVMVAEIFAFSAFFFSGRSRKVALFFVIFIVYIFHSFEFLGYCWALSKHGIDSIRRFFKRFQYCVEDIETKLFLFVWKVYIFIIETFYILSFIYTKVWLILKFVLFLINI